MKPADQVLKELSDLYEFNRRIKSYRLKEEPAGGNRTTARSSTPDSSSDSGSSSPKSYQ